MNAHDSTPMSGTSSLNNVGELIASMPYLLGVRPVDSLIVMGYRENSTQICLRADLPRTDEVNQVAASLLYILSKCGVTDVAIVVVGASEGQEQQQLPHSDLVSVLNASFEVAGLVVLHSLWTPEISCGVRWQCYQDPACTGLVPDPETTAMAAVAAAAGHVTYSSPEELKATLEPTDRDAVGRRAELLRIKQEDDSGADRREWLRLVDDAVARAEQGVLPTEDQEIIELGLVLTDHLVRDAMFMPHDESGAAAAEHLWTVLVRELPAPYRAEPACLLAMSLLLEGRGVMARAVLEVATTADPANRLAELLTEAYRSALTPDRLRNACGLSTEYSRTRIGKGDG